MLLSIIQSNGNKKYKSNLGIISQIYYYFSDEVDQYPLSQFIRSFFIFGVNLLQTILYMQDQPTQIIERGTMRNKDIFNYGKLILNWDDFKNTFKAVKIDQSFNHAEQDFLKTFWNTHLTQLITQTQRISILIPSKVETKANQQEKQQKGQKDGKNNKKGKKDTKQNNLVQLSFRVIEIAINLVKQKYPSLDYDYESLYMGNDKQLLIYRRCYAIQKYVEKYRLPKIFQVPFSNLTSLCQELFKLKTIRNKQISLFQSSLLQQTNKRYEIMLLKIQDQLQILKPILQKVIDDFKQKKKCKQIVLFSLPSQLSDFLRPICQSKQTQIINKYNQTEHDQYKDMVIVKENDIRLKIQEKQIDDGETKIQYTYIEEVKKPQGPKDLRDIQFVRIDIENQCYVYKFILPTVGALNPLNGIFIRSKMGSKQSYEQNIDVNQQIKDLSVKVYPFKQGKCIYEIYLWNQYGITKSSETITFYNQLSVANSSSPKIRNLPLYFLGQSKLGLLGQQQQSTNGLIKRFSFGGKQYSIKQISLGNAAIMCDGFGDVAGWGQMYYHEEQEQSKKKPQEGIVIEEVKAPLMRIEDPCLLLGNQYISKVSCGGGYCLMLSIFGTIFSMGANIYGQLGMGHFNSSQSNMTPVQISKITDKGNKFITDIKATSTGASFAIDQQGSLYRWGFNQVDTTNSPVYDRFDSIVNYALSPMYYKNCFPTRIGKSYIQGQTKQVESGNLFYVALMKHGDLYGWGQAQYLGIDDLKDRNQNVVKDFANPLVVATGVEYVSVGSDHTVAITKDKRVLGWGNTTAFSHKIKTFAKRPIDITEQYGGHEDIKQIKAGFGFTVLLTHSNTLRIMGGQGLFKEHSYHPDFQVKSISTSYEPLIALIGIPKQ